MRSRYKKQPKFHEYSKLSTKTCMSGEKKMNNLKDCFTIFNLIILVKITLLCHAIYVCKVLNVVKKAI